MSDFLRSYRRYARELRRQGYLRSAGEYYVAGAYGELMRFRPLPDEPEGGEQPSQAHRTSHFAYGIRQLLLGGLCFRLDGSLDRCRNYCEQGDLFVSDLLTSGEFEAEPMVGLCHEITGDLRVVGDLANAESAYETAAEYYAGTESHLGWQMEDEFDDFSLLVSELADSTGYDIDPETREQITRTSLDARIRFKREHFSEIIKAVLADGNWNSEVL